MNNGPYINRSGDVISSNLNAANTWPDAQQSYYNFPFLVEGQIIQIYPVDDKNNMPDASTAKVTLYDVLVKMPDGGTQISPRCRMMQSMFGGTYNSFEEVLPNNPGPQAEEGKDSQLKTGAKVAVMFLNGQKTSGVIMGTLPHQNPVAIATRPKKAKGTHYEKEFQGLNQQITNDGEYIITFNSPKDDSGKPSTNNGPTVIKIDAQGNVEVTTNESQRVECNRVKKEINLTNGPVTYSMKQDGEKIEINCKELTVNAGKQADLIVKGPTNVKAQGPLVLDSAVSIALSKGGATTTPMPLGAPLVGVLTAILQILISHTHIGNFGGATPMSPGPASGLAQIIPQLQSILSGHVTSI